MSDFLKIKNGVALPSGGDGYLSVPAQDVLRFSALLSPQAAAVPAAVSSSISPFDLSAQAKVGLKNGEGLAVESKDLEEDQRYADEMSFNSANRLFFSRLMACVEEIRKNGEE